VNEASRVEFVEPAFHPPMACLISIVPCLARLQRSPLSPVKRTFVRIATIAGNVDYLTLRGQLTTIDELLETGCIEKIL
jgi:hypothetical protein